MTNQELLQIALQQSAIDCNCKPEDFLQNENIVTESRKHPSARSYLPLPFACDLVSYGNNIVAQVREDLRDTVKDYINTYPPEHCFETPNMQVLEEKLAPYGLQICFMAEYFLPDLTSLGTHPCKYEIRLLHPQDFQSLYLPQWSNALCADRKEKDVLCVGAYDGDTLIGLAGASPETEDRRRTDFPADRGNLSTWQSSVLLRCLVQYPFREKCHHLRLPPRLGGTYRTRKILCRAMQHTAEIILSITANISYFLTDCYCSLRCFFLLVVLQS